MTVGARDHGFEPLHRPIVFARTKRLIGGGSLPPKGTQWVTMLVSMPPYGIGAFLSRSLAVSGVSHSKHAWLRTVSMGNDDFEFFFGACFGAFELYRIGFFVWNYDGPSTI